MDKRLFGAVVVTNLLNEGVTDIAKRAGSVVARSTKAVARTSWKNAPSIVKGTGVVHKYVGGKLQSVGTHLGTFGDKILQQNPSASSETTRYDKVRQIARNIAGKVTKGAGSVARGIGSTVMSVGSEVQRGGENWANTREATTKKQEVATKKQEVADKNSKRKAHRNTMTQLERDYNIAKIKSRIGSLTNPTNQLTPEQQQDLDEYKALKIGIINKATNKIT
jgi:hypothetical protein